MKTIALALCCCLATGPAAAAMFKWTDTQATREPERSHKEAPEKAPPAAVRARNCRAARHNLAVLQRGGHRRFRTRSGTLVYLTAAQRARRIAIARKQIAEFCPGAESQPSSREP